MVILYCPFCTIEVAIFRRLPPSARLPLRVLWASGPSCRYFKHSDYMERFMRPLYGVVSSGQVWHSQPACVRITRVLPTRHQCMDNSRVRDLSSTISALFTEVGPASTLHKSEDAILCVRAMYIIRYVPAYGGTLLSGGGFIYSRP